ncbi:uncharacterized protein EAF02_012092 [Botrytis sinoallii]|uniref:uncharacterized protein n=1 Tax=Botrytis sinoallii TaxID=1463999 RepID=UPI001902989F|nr:uncharacterized protein EAF02_012092 [Botrytis sinoallii]KAF7852862.1 hypothetical protein EAF02_012092 [Botrytis sinoallii]
MITFSAAGGSLEISEIACQSCRQRKLKCNRAKPKCDTCTRLQHRCEYPERKKPIARKSQSTREKDPRPVSVVAGAISDEHENTPTVPATVTGSGDLGLDSSFEFNLDVTVLSSQEASTPLGSSAGQELIELGLQEALPPQELIDELHHIFFTKFYPSMPMIHEYRYYRSLTRAPLARPPICLRYAIWASAALLSEKYKSFEDLLYKRARRYLDASEMKGEGFVNVYYAQTWCLIAMLEAKNARFSQSWMSVGRAVRLVQMLGLYALDVERGDAKQVLPPAQDWTELEERRRTFWTAFYGDRWASVLTELSFEFGLAEETKPFTQAFSPSGLGQISPFSALLLTSKLYEHNREHLNINSPNECVEDIDNGEFWKRHRRLDNALLNTFLYLPDSLRLPHGSGDMNTVFIHMSIHASSIKLHQGAVAAAMKHGISSDIVRHSQVRALTAAEEITNIMRQIDNVDVDLLNSWTGFCLYVAASVLIKDQQSDQIFGQGLRNLNYLLSAMQKIGHRHKITDFFYRQSRRDIIAAGLGTFGEGLIYA